MYYYLVASLPSLAFGEPAPISWEDFLSTCLRTMTPADAEELQAFGRGDAGSVRSDCARAWFRQDAALRNALVRERAARAGADAAPYLSAEAGFSVYINQAVEDAYAKPNPLEREMELDRFRWAMTEDLARGHGFDLTAVLAYAAHLRLNLRWQDLKEPAGAQRLEDQLNALLATPDT